MQYQLPIRNEDANYIIFKTNTPLKNIKKIKYYREGSSFGNFLNKTFRYSFDNVNWSIETQLTQLEISSIPFNINQDFYLEVKYEKDPNNLNGISSFFIFFTLFERQELPGNMDYQPVDASEAPYLKYDFPGYIQNRLNHNGPYADLGIKPNEDPSIYDLYSHREDSSNGTNFIFKGLKAGNGITLTEDSSYIKIDASGGTGSSVIYENPQPVVVGVGGISQGETFFDGGKSFAETMEEMFYPVVYPTLTNPSSSFTDNIGTLFEINQNINITFTTNFNQGSIVLNGVTQNPRSGPSDIFNYHGPNLELSWNSNGATTHQESITYDVSPGYTTWTNNVHYTQGPQPIDSKGNNYNSPLPAGNTSTDSIRIEGVYPLFATTSDINILTKQPLVSMITSNYIEFDLVSEDSNVTPSIRQKFAIPTYWLNNRPLDRVETYNPLTQMWEVETGGLTRWTTSNIQQNIQGINIDYIMYEYNNPSERGAMKIRIIF